jgi:hypothetical protein
MPSAKRISVVAGESEMMRFGGAADQATEAFRAQSNAAVSRTLTAREPERRIVNAFVNLLPHNTELNKVQQSSLAKLAEAAKGINTITSGPLLAHIRTIQ